MVNKRIRNREYGMSRLNLGSLIGHAPYSVFPVAYSLFGIPCSVFRIFAVTRNPLNHSSNQKKT
jgi:hypothetical protein